MNTVDYLKSLFRPLTGQRTALSLFTEGDICDTYIGWLNDRIVTQFSNQRFLSHSHESCLRYFRTFENSENLLIKIQRLSDMKFIGTMTIYHNFWHGTADIGILIGDRCSWGQGLGQDAWDTSLKWLASLPRIRKITAGTMRANEGMLRIMDRSGMHLEAVRIKQEILNGNPQDIVYYALFPNVASA